MKILLLTILMAFPILVHAKDPITAKDFIESVEKNKKFNENCEYSNHDILDADKILNLNIKLQLSKFGDLTLKDFDMGECITSENIKNGILTTQFWQKNKNYKGKSLTIYLAYKATNQNLLLAINDEDSKTYLIGDKDDELKESLKTFSANLTNTDGININSNLAYSDFIKNEADSEYKYSKEVDAILYPAWIYSCKKDRFDNSKSCYMHNNDIGILLLNGMYAVSIGRDHYPRSKASLKVDNNATLMANEGMFTQNANAVIAQFKKGKIAYTRFTKWPYQYQNIDRESKLTGFTEIFNEMLETYKKL